VVCILCCLSTLENKFVIVLYMFGDGLRHRFSLVLILLRSKLDKRKCLEYEEFLFVYSKSEYTTRIGQCVRPAVRPLTR
jgi:hypothetical protein